MTTYLISDLHLSEDEPALTALFFEFLREHSPNMAALYLLGDFFDAWVGDDDDRALASEISDALVTLAASGCQLFFMHGNRDFLVGPAFAERGHLQLLPDIAPVADLGVVLCHGDHLCTHDTAYQNFRAQVRNPVWQAQFLSQPLQVRRAFAAKAREQSRLHQLDERAEIADVGATEVNNMQREYPAQTLIHGHTHRPGVLQTPHGQRVVLGDWQLGKPSWICLNAGAGELVAHGKRWLFSTR
jgi:UDP-2,3-diacylglucosamine hydrolase